jgi:hypothetical protein
MPRKTKKSTAKKSARRGSPNQIATTRREYNAVKRTYHKVGKAAFGKPASSTVKKEYAVVKRAYKKIGKELGRLTGLR